MEFKFEPIGIIRSCFTGKFGIPRQPRLVTAATSRLEMFGQFARGEAFAEIQGFSHLWLIFVFHAHLGAGWNPTVRPPRLGARRRVGVFASRSPYRPNPIGISAVRNLGIERRAGKLCVDLGGTDLLDGTPVLDVKPYVPYADAIPNADAGFAGLAPGRDWPVRFSNAALKQIATEDRDESKQLAQLITQVLQQDPRPGYLDRYPERTNFGMRLYDLEVRWTIDRAGVQVVFVGPPERGAVHSEPAL